MLVAVDAPHFYAGIILDDNEVCVRAAPILKWAIGKRRSELSTYFKRKGWKSIVVKNERTA